MEYKWLTTKDIWQELEPNYPRQDVTWQHLDRLRSTKLLRSQRVRPEAGATSELMWALTTQGARALGMPRLGTQYTRIPQPERVRYWGMLLSIERQLRELDFAFARPEDYNSEHPMPARTPQSRILRKHVKAKELEIIEAELRRYRLRYSQAITLPDAKSPTNNEALQLLSPEYLADEEERLTRNGVKSFLAERGFLDVLAIGIPLAAKIESYLHYDPGTSYPTQLNDYVAWLPKAPAQTIIIVPHPPDARRHFWTRGWSASKGVAAVNRERSGRMLLYKPVQARFRCVAVFDADDAGQRAQQVLERDLRQAKWVVLPVNGLTEYIQANA